MRSSYHLFKLGDIPLFYLICHIEFMVWSFWSVLSDLCVTCKHGCLVQCPWCYHSILENTENKLYKSCLFFCKTQSDFGSLTPNIGNNLQGEAVTWMSNRHARSSQRHKLSVKNPGAMLRSILSRADFIFVFTAEEIIRWDTSSLILATDLEVSKNNTYYLHRSSYWPENWISYMCALLIDEWSVNVINGVYNDVNAAADVTQLRYILLYSLQIEQSLAV